MVTIEEYGVWYFEGDLFSGKGRSVAEIECKDKSLRERNYNILVELHRSRVLALKPGTIDQDQLDHSDKRIAPYK